MVLTNLVTWPYIIITFIVAIVLLYIARSPVHQAIRSLSRIFYKTLRLTSRSVMLAEKRLERRNKEVLLAAGRESIEKEIEREFHRVNSVVQRDLQGYPALHRSMSDLITRIDEDYRESTESPPSPPGWLNAIESVSQIPSSEKTLVGNMLGEIHRTLQKHHKETMEKYRKAIQQRHSLLIKMMPFWRKLTNKVNDIGKTINGLLERAKIIDNRMAQYEEIRSGTDRAVSMLSSSSMTQFVKSGLVMLIAMGGIIVNFNLIALPMSEMVGGGSYIGPFNMSNIAALVIIIFESVLGIFLMESLRITRLFPVIHTMDDRLRRRMILWSFIFLLALACVESALAFMRDLIAADNQALRQALAGTEVVESSHRWIPTVGQMLLGFILPFALSLIAIPLESFIDSSRTLLGVILAAMLRGFAFTLRLAGSILNHLGEVIVTLYDILIFPLLWIEKIVHDKLRESKINAKEEAVR